MRMYAADCADAQGWKEAVPINSARIQTPQTSISRSVARKLLFGHILFLFTEYPFLAAEREF